MAICYPALRTLLDIQALLISAAHIAYSAFPCAEVHALEEIKTPTEIVLAKRRQRVLH